MTEGSPQTFISNRVRAGGTANYLGFRKPVISKCTQDVVSANFLSYVLGLNLKRIYGLKSHQCPKDQSVLQPAPLLVPGNQEVYSLRTGFLCGQKFWVKVFCPDLARTTVYLLLCNLTVLASWEYTIRWDCLKKKNTKSSLALRTELSKTNHTASQV